MIICGAWYRLLFSGEWEHTTDHDKYTFNLQTNTLFIDVRILKLAEELLPTVGTASSVFQYLSQMSPHQLRARRHVFAGFTIPTYTTNDNNNYRLHCTRHHMVDWNYVGQPRPRPNKWYVDTGNYPTNVATNGHNPSTDSRDNLQVWKEYSFVTNPHDGQYYYMETWQRLDNDNDGNKDRRLALISQDYKSMFIIIGNNFNYVWGRSSNTLLLQQRKQEHYQNILSSPSLVGLVDLALKMGDRDTAELFLSMDAGHGKIMYNNPPHQQGDGTNDSTSSGYEFIIDHAIAYWKNNTHLFSNEDDNNTNNITIHGRTLEDCTILWNDTAFTVVESSFSNLQQLQKLFTSPSPPTYNAQQPHQFALNNNSKL